MKDHLSVAEKAFETVRTGSDFLKKLSVKERLSYLSRLKKVVLSKQDWIVDQIQAATGKPRTDALVSEIFGVLDHLSYLEKFSAKILSDRSVHTPLALLGKKSSVYFEPLGTLLVISPWNYPFYQALVPITSALACGNTVVYKPSEYTPLKLVVETLLEEAGIPSNWVQVVYGDGKLGEELIHQKPEKIFFTGSTRTGKKIMEMASQYLIPVELELGGKDPMIVFGDTHLHRATSGAIWGAFTNMGQSCTSVEKLLIQDSIYGAFKEMLLLKVKDLKQAKSADTDGASDFTVMTNDMQVRIVAEHIEDAVNKGAVLLTGKEWDRKSKSIPPIVLEKVTRDMKVFSEETFGPVLPLLTFTTEEECIQLANDTQFGLSASVWSGDLARAHRVARSLITGNVSINNVMVTEGNHALPFGGVKQSGFGRYKGEFGLYSFSNIKSIISEKSSGKIESNWYPYTPEKYTLFKRLIQGLFGGGISGFFKFLASGLKLESYSGKVAKLKRNDS